MFNVDKLRNKLNTFNERGEKGDKEWPNTVFLPEGTHKGRFLVDPTGEPFESYYAYGYFNKGVRDPRGLDKEDLPEGFIDELKEVADELAERGKWKFRSKEVFLACFYLEKTDNKDWEPGKLYYIIGNKKFSSAYVKFLTSISEDSASAITEVLDPNAVNSPLIEIQVTSGAQGGVNITVAYPHKNAPVIDLTKQVYVSLQEAYIKPGFNADKYKKLLDAAIEELNKTPEKSAESEDKEKAPEEFQDQGDKSSEEKDDPKVEEKSEEKEEEPQQSSATSRWAQWKK